MGFLDYAWALSLQKDNLSVKIRIDSDIRQPILLKDDLGFNVTLPLPTVSDEGNISFLQYEFQENSSKIQVGRLFRACVFHLTAHTLIDSENVGVEESNHSYAEAFSDTLANDIYVNTYLSAKHPDKLVDLAYANSLALVNMKTTERIFNPATRLMAALLTKVNMGMVKGKLRPEEEDVLTRLNIRLTTLRDEVAASVAGKEAKVGEVLNEVKVNVAEALELNGPVLEAPSLPHTEYIGPCTVLSPQKTYAETQVEKAFGEVLNALGGTLPSEESVEQCWKSATATEIVQVFDSWRHQKAREQKIVKRLERYLEGTRFKSVSFPEEDHTQYLRARLLLKGGSRRLLDSLRVAQDALDEDPRKEQGQLDLTEVIQKIASNSPRTDVFMENEYLSKSFAWGILLDASASMEIRGEVSRALAICVAEATKELLMDPNSWSFYAFNDSFYVLKDSSEAYSQRVRARIGGLKFRGLTYMPDALRVAGKILGQRFDEQRFLIVLSDGWPHGYPEMPTELSKVIDSLQKKGLIIIGVGLESERMSSFFKESCSVYNQRDLIKKFSNIYVNASTTALET
jgi:Mg-chelatase subunit ChlD